MRNRDSLLPLLDRAVPMIDAWVAEAPGYDLFRVLQYQLTYVQNQVRSGQQANPSQEDIHRLGLVITMAVRRFDGMEDTYGEFISLINDIYFMYAYP